MNDTATVTVEDVKSEMEVKLVVRGESIEDTLKTLMSGTGMEKIVENMGSLGSGKFIARTGTDGGGLSIDHD